MPPSRRHGSSHARPRIGRRGRFLLCLAVIDVAYGASLVGPAAEALTLKSTVWLQHFAPIWTWGVGWLFVGAVLLVSAFMRHDALGYATAIGWKILCGGITIAAWMFGDVDRGWILSIVWFGSAGMVSVVSGWAEPERMGTDE